MSTAVLPGLEVPDQVLEAEMRERLGEVESALASAVRQEPGMLGETSGYLLAAGGKRFRPMLVLSSGHFGDPTDPRLIPGAVAVELVHLATLYHDDVIDQASARRGIPSANARWDNTVAILTGDFLFARASEIISDVGNEPTRLIAHAIATVCDGQIREVTSEGRLDRTVDQYMGTIARKTSALTAASCRLGGVLSGAPERLLGVLEEFGDELGTAFQLSDDIMDITATNEALGKEPGADLRGGVYTLPVLDALARDGGELAALLSGEPLEGERFQRALHIVRSNGSIARSREVVSATVDRALELAGRLPECPARGALEHLSRFLATRCGASA